MSYTIDLTEKDGTWTWRLYERGGSVFIFTDHADTIEGALADAGRALLVQHRATLRAEGQ